VSDSNVIKLTQPGVFTDSLTEILRSGARALLTQAVEAEVAEFLAKHADLKIETGQQRVVRHGHLPEREIITWACPGPARERRPIASSRNCWRWPSCSNVAVKATRQGGYAEDEYPFRSLHPHLHRCFDAFGPERMFWGTDITRDALLLAAMRDLVRGIAVAQGRRPRGRTTSSGPLRRRLKNKPDSENLI
jgi:hypothetical protein